MLVLVLAVLTVSYASSLRAYLQQRSHIGDLKAQIAEREASINDLEREKKRWDDPADEAAIRAQLKRRPRGIDSIGHRCPCGNPDVVTTEPRLPNGTPFPTTFYLTCPRAASRIGTLEGNHVMKEMQDRLGTDDDLAAAYRAAHERYLEARAAVGERAGMDVPEIEGISAGGMPDRVKCLHVLAGQSLAMGRGVNPLGDEVLDALGEWWAQGPCVSVDPPE